MPDRRLPLTTPNPPGADSRRRLALGGQLPFVLVLLVGTLLSVALFVVLEREADDVVARRVRAAAQERLERLTTTAQRSLELLHGLTAFLQVSAPSRAEFRRFAEPSLRRLSEVQALEWIPRVAPHDRARLEALAREDGIVGFRFTELDPDGALVTAGEREEYYPVYYAEPPHPNRPAFGLDLASDPARAAALSRAARTGDMVASAPVRLAQEQHSGKLGYLVFSPIPEPAGDGDVAGFALAVFRVDSLARPAFESMPPGDFEVSLLDVTDEPLMLASFGGPLRAARPDAAHRTHLELAGRRLAIDLVPSATFLQRNMPRGRWGYPLCFFGLTLILSAHLRRSSLRAREIETKVAERTAELTREIAARREVERRLRGAEAWLEEQVRERTRELSHANERLSAEITIRREAQQQAAKAHEAKSRFLASMSHEIRTPLNAIIGYAQMLHRDSRDATSRDALEVMLQSSDHLLTLVDDILDLSKIEAGHVALAASDFDLERLISSLGFLFRHKCEQRGLSLMVEGLGGEARWVRGDEAKLRQILINLLGNAVKFTERGSVRLSVRTEADGAVTFAVADTGSGIDADDRARLFQSFQQGKHARPGMGTGLGLAISKQLVELMGGRLELESRPGQGSTFRFTLPLEEPLSVAPSQARSSVPRSRLAPGTSCRCLVVDDVEVNRRLLCQVLDSLGCTSLGLASGEQALREAGRFGPQIVFMDVGMPDMDGFQATRALLQGFDDTRPRVVAFSASALADERAAYREAGFDDFLPKPFRIQQVSECLSRLLDVRFVPDEPAPLEPDAGREGPGGAERVARLPRAELDPSASAGDRVPAALLASLRDAARLYQATRLKSLLGELEGLGPEQAVLARRLKRLADVYDMPAVARVIDVETVPA